MESAADQIRAAKETGDIQPPVELTFAEKYPLHQKLSDRKVEHEAVSDFLAWWYDEQQGWLANGVGTDVDYDKLGGPIGQYFEVDEEEFEAEKQQMLKSIRETGNL